MAIFTLKQLAELTQATLVGDPDYEITGVDSLESAGPKDASFVANPRYLTLLKKTKAGVVCVSEQELPTSCCNFLICKDPSVAFQQIINALLVQGKKSSGFSGIHPSAIVHPSAKIGSGVTIGPYAVVDEGVIIEDHAVVSAHVFLGSFVQIGASSYLYPHVTIREGCQIGKRVVIQPGAVIGSCGFGFSTSAQGEHTKLEQLGNVLIEDDVEIGANTAIDRARFKTTRIGRGTKIDNLVQIGHNVELGIHNLVVSQTGIAGSVKTGRNVVFGGQAGIVGHIEIGDFVMIGAKGGVSKSMPEKGKYAGSPVLPLAEHNRQQVHLRNIESYVKRIQTLEEQLKKLENLYQR